MKRRLTAWVVLLALVMSLWPLMAWAESPAIYDEVGMLSDSERASLESFAQRMEKETGVKVRFAFVEGEEELDDYPQQALGDDTLEAWRADGVSYLCMVVNDQYINVVGYGDGGMDDDALDELMYAYIDAETYYYGVENYLWLADEMLGGTTAATWVAESAEEETATPVIPEEHPGVYFVDEAGLLSDEDGSRLNSKLEEISDRQGMDVVVVTVETLGGQSSMEAADDYYDYNGFGQGPDRDGILLLVCPEERDYWMSTTGYGVTAFTDAGLEYIGDKLKAHLKDDDYKAGFDEFAKQADLFITQAHTDRPYDHSNLPKGPLSFLWIPFSLALGAVIGRVRVNSMRKKLKTIQSEDSASNYQKDGSLHVDKQRDIFLYSNVVSHYNPPKSDSGSSTHTSSSGTTHGGGGGKY